MTQIFKIPEQYNNLLDGPFFVGPNIDKSNASDDPDVFTFFSHYTHFTYRCEKYDDIEIIFEGCRDILNVAENDCLLGMIDNFQKIILHDKPQFLQMKNSWNINIYSFYVMDCGYLEVCAKSCSVKIGDQVTVVG
jgi:hypothetical protein